ncbi:DUF2778 domain-containing protein [Pseudanabaena sp. 'Roaring Creek']|uniref:DUF2778 domain-containing protein n=1 Tax=Pseudanabaena sp. 'Roaring Creek' TaxID=1681830 RepID=UPI0006D7FDF1|nr:DUF2778 domain-containing protein [Pseudanabaena sp. 'Roaring Creek']
MTGYTFGSFFHLFLLPKTSQTRSKCTDKSTNDPSGNIAPRSNGGSLSDNARSPRNIQAVFDYRSAILTLKDRETSETLQIQAFSGGGSEERFRKNGKKGTVHAILDTGYVNRRDLTHIRDFGGVPPRVYDILEFAIDPDYGYRLDRHDSIPRDDIDQYNGRFGYRLHSYGNSSAGCVTVKEGNYFDSDTNEDEETKSIARRVRNFINRKSILVTDNFIPKPNPQDNLSAFKSFGRSVLNTLTYPTVKKFGELVVK